MATRRKASLKKDIKMKWRDVWRLLAKSDDGPIFAAMWTFTALASKEATAG